MTQQRIVIVNTGCANISSVKFALERLAVAVEVSDDLSVIKTADKVFLPGVGSANAAMNSINKKHLVTTLQSLTQPVLGVCLGMQLMVELSEEGPNGVLSPAGTKCISLIPGRVKRLQAGKLRLPHMGWNTVTIKKPNPLFNGISTGAYFYFVHSFAIADYEHTIASCEYGAVFSAAINKNNFFGVQFHPERSSDAGAHLLKNFVEM